MSEATKHATAIPIRKTRKVPVMAPTVQSQARCSTNMENNSSYPRGQTGLPRNRLGNRFKKPILSEYRQNQVAPKPRAPTENVIKSKISKSTPDLSRNKTRPKLVPIPANLQKIKSLENLEKGRRLGEKSQPHSRIPTKSFNVAKFKPAPVNDLIKKPKRLEVMKKTVMDVKRMPKQMENKRKSCVENPSHSKQKITSKELLSPTAFPCSSSPPKSRIEECRNIVKKITLDKKLLDVCERGRSSGDFEDSIGTWNSDELADLLKDTTRTSCELDTSKRNSNELDDSIGSFFSDQMVLKLSKSTEFLNGPKQGFLNDNQPSLSMSEEFDNLTPGLPDLSNAMDRTPSAEDLPMECDTTIQATSARSNSPELPQESLSSRTTNAPVSIVTSITSIMSLDTGYQGDGELSRPESRNTENESRLKLPVAENGIPVRAIHIDDGKTTTDSDFFTESDVDVHDDLSAAVAEIGSGKGDRKAQVIDGTLYGGAFIQAHVPRHNTDRVVQPAGSTNEDMESSGIYSDLEKKTEEGLKEPASYLAMITEQMKMIQSLAMLVAEGRFRQDPPLEVTKSSSAESNTIVQEATSSGETSAKTVKKQDKKTTLPNRGTTPRKKDNATPEVVRTKTVKKGKWDAVMDKIAQGKEENKYSPSKFRDIKSKVFQNIGPLFNGRKSEPDVKTPTNAQSKVRSRRSTRIRSSESSLVSPKSKLSRTSASPNSSQRSSLSDISVSGGPHQKSANRASKKRESISPPSNESTNSANTPTRKLNNNNETVSTGNRATTPCRNSDLQNGNVVRTPSATTLIAMKTPIIRKTPTPRRNESIGQTLHRTASVPLKDSNHNGVVSKSGSGVIINNNNSAAQKNNKVKSSQSFQSKSLKVGATRGANAIQVKNGCLLTVAKDTNKALLKQLKHNSRAFESLAILFAYCTNDLDAFATPQLKQKLDAERSKFNQAQSDLEELQSRLIRVREELNDKELVITELKNDKLSLSENFQKLVDELREELKVMREHKREAESELLKECESVRNLRRELSDRTDCYETEKENLAARLSEIKKENGVLKSANREIKEEYDKCLVENQRLVELISKRQTEVARLGKENVVGEERRRDEKEKSPSRIVASSAPERGSSINPSSLESEVESLRQVLALKTDEVTELRRQELSLRENADRVPKLLSTITMLEGKVEDLQTQLSSQTETVRDLFKSNEHLEEELKSVNIQKTRLTHKNEELQYKLKQYTEAMKQLANQKNLSESTIKAELSPQKSNLKKHDGSQDDSMKSQMKAVVEKSDSVSYMLEMTEDSSEIVTNIIRRAESLRSTNRDTLPKKKRSKACSMSSADADRFKRNPSTEEDFRPGVMSTPIPNQCELECLRAADGSACPGISPIMFQKTVKLNQDDFSINHIELPNGNDCEVIEITKNFDKMEKNAEMVTSTSSNASSSESHFDIESDVFSNLDNDQNIHELDEDTESSEFQENKAYNIHNHFIENTKPVLPVYTDIDPVDGGHSLVDDDENVKGPFAKALVKMPKLSGGEAMIGLSSDEEEIDKIRMNV